MDAEPSDTPLPARDKPVDGNDSSTKGDHPKPLRESVTLIERLLAEKGDPAAGVWQLCERAAASPAALTAPAGRFLSRLLADGKLGTCPDVPPAYLVEELIQGSLVILPVKMAQWEARDDFSQHVRLADKLADKAGQLKDCSTDAADVIIRLAHKIAIQRPVRSGRLIEIASPVIAARDDQAKLTEARRWQAAGEFLNGKGREHRSFWQRVMDHPADIDWAGPVAARAVTFLKEAQDKGESIPPALLEKIPPAESTPGVESRDEEAKRTTTAAEPARLVESKGEEPVLTPAEEPAAEPAPVRGNSGDSGRQKQKSGFFSGFALGGLTMFVAALWVWKDSILLPAAKMPGESHPAVTEAPAKSSEKTASSVKATPAPAPVIPAPEPAMLPPPPPTAAAEPAPAPAATVAMAEQKPAAKESQPPPAAASSSSAEAAEAKSVEPAVAKEPNPPSAPKSANPADAWRKAEFAALAARHPSMVRWHGAVRTAKWREAGPLVQGLQSYLRYTSEEYVPFLKLLLLDPPTDPEVAEAVPKLAARRMKSAELLPLWEKLVYPGSPNEKPIRAAARVYLDMKNDVLGTDAREQLTKIAAP